jgi:hypothetical protein
VGGWFGAWFDQVHYLIKRETEAVKRVISYAFSSNWGFSPRAKRRHLLASRGVPRRFYVVFLKNLTICGILLKGAQFLVPEMVLGVPQGKPRQMCGLC